uniref:WD repeat domain 38 n=1 Tax=Cyprinus carpio TaxID=7962 RepID=A0A8C2JWU3_CYPCA
MWRHPSLDLSVSNIRYFSKHKGEVNCCAFSPDCQIMLTCCDDGRLYLWNATSAKHLATFNGHSGPVKSCVFSSDGQLFASASHDRTVRIWSRSSTECTHILTGTHTRFITTHINSNTDLSHDSQLQHFSQTGSVETVSFSPDGQWLVSGGWDNRALIWRVQVTNTHHELLHLLFLSVQASGSWDGTVRVWLPLSHACLFVLGGCERVWVRSLAFSRDGLVLASTAEGDMVRIWDVTTGVCLKRLQGHKDSAYGCVFTPDGKLLTSGSEQLDVEEDEENSTEESLNTGQDCKE